jgi:hypothetical protein
MGLLPIAEHKKAEAYEQLSGAAPDADTKRTERSEDKDCKPISRMKQCIGFRGEPFQVICFPNRHIAGDKKYDFRPRRDEFAQAWTRRARDTCPHDQQIALAGRFGAVINRRRVRVSEQKNECLLQLGLYRARDTITEQQWLRRGGRNRPGLDFAQNFAQHGSQLFAAHLALAELHAHMKRIILGAIVE